MRCIAYLNSKGFLFLILPNSKKNTVFDLLVCFTQGKAFVFSLEFRKISHNKWLKIWLKSSSHCRELVTAPFNLWSWHLAFPAEIVNSLQLPSDKSKMFQPHCPCLFLFLKDRLFLNDFFCSRSHHVGVVCMPFLSDVTCLLVFPLCIIMKQGY